MNAENLKLAYALDRIAGTGETLHIGDHAVSSCRGGFIVHSRPDLFSDYGPGRYPLTIEQVLDRVTT